MSEIAIPAATDERNAFVDVIREITIGGLAGVISGIVIGGLGGRLVMRAAAALNPEATGLRTENGAVIGQVSFEGTMALLVFGGLFAGFAAGFVWVVVQAWLPQAGIGRYGAGALVAVALGAPLLIQTSNPDFVTLGADEPILAMLIGLVALIGVTCAWLAGRLDRRLPRDPVAGSWAGLYVLVATAGLLLVLPIVIGVYLTPSNCPCFAPPFIPGWAVVVAGLATLGSWVGAARPARLALVAYAPLVGRAAVVVATIAGLARLADVVRRILSL